MNTDNNEIDMFDGNFNYLGSFTDPYVPSTMGAYGVQNVNGKLYVTFAGFGQFEGGIVDVFDTDGTCCGASPTIVRRVRSRRPGGLPSLRTISECLARLF